MEEYTGGRNVPRRRYAPPKKRNPMVIWLILAVILVLAVAALLIWFFGFEKVYQEAWNTMPAEGTLRLTQQEDGTIFLQWPQGANVEYYEVLICSGDRLIPKDEEEETYTNLLHRQEVRDGVSCVIPDLSTGEDMTIEVRSCRTYQTLFGQETRRGEASIRATGSFAAPVVENLHWEADPDADTLTLRYELLENQVCQLLVSLDNGAHTWLMELEGNSPVLRFGPDQTFQLPTYEQNYAFHFGSYIQTDTYLHQGIAYEGFSLEREAFLGTDLNLKLKDEGLNRYTLTWDETKGTGYEVQRYEQSQDSWIMVAQVEQDGELSYSTGYLDSYADYRYRVVALGETETPPDEVEFGTGATPMYATIWPLTDQKVYADARKTSTLGTAKKGTAFCVLDMENNLFKVRFENTEGWIDSNYCMINLPEFLGDLCSYDITNSYASIFMVHGYEITGVTGMTVSGYEQIALSEKEYLVPLLYPTALKLEEAALAAQQSGCRLKIYDSYRPGVASQSVRDMTEVLLDQPLPETTYNNIVITDMPQVPEGQILTYDDLMTNDGQYTINFFIAAYGSRHNYGVALDLTLEDVETGEELLMQSAIHDLSHYAVLKRNVPNADLLSKLMRGAGFGTLVSEWWHFQDNEALEALNLKALWNGVTPEGWKADNNGWRYRRASGSYYRDCTRTIDGVEYTFDQNGYVVES